MPPSVPAPGSPRKDRRRSDDPPGEPNGAVEGVAVLTVEANDLVRPLHDRMSAAMPPEHFAAWWTRGSVTPRCYCWFARTRRNGCGAGRSIRG